MVSHSGEAVTPDLPVPPHPPLPKLFFLWDWNGSSGESNLLSEAWELGFRSLELELSCLWKIRCECFIQQCIYKVEQNANT